MRKRPRLVHALIFATAAVPLIATLVPTGGAAPSCLVCAERWLADVALNILLLAPLGMVLASWWRSFAKVVATVLLLSVTIEALQTVVPGRHPSVVDVFFNVFGAALGAVAVLASPGWLAPSPRRGHVLAVASAGAAAALLVTGVLIHPSYPRAKYYGQWTPDLAHLQHYEGRVLRATLGPVELPPWRLDDPRRVQDLLSRGAPLSVRAVAGPPTSAVAPLVSIFDEDEREVMLLGVDRGDLVFRTRTRATAVGLDRPDMRFAGIVEAIAPGDTVDIRLWRQGGDLCASVAWAVRCGRTPGVERGWALLLYPEHLPPWARDVADAAWVALLVLPFGFWARSRASLLLGAGLLAAGLAGVFAIPAAGVALAGTLSGASVGALTGLLVGHVVRTRRSICRTRATPGPAGALGIPW